MNQDRGTSEEPDCEYLLWFLPDQNNKLGGARAHDHTLMKKTELDREKAVEAGKSDKAVVVSSYWGFYSQWKLHPGLVSKMVMAVSSYWGMPRPKSKGEDRHLDDDEFSVTNEVCAFYEREIAKSEGFVISESPGCADFNLIQPRDLNGDEYIEYEEDMQLATFLPVYAPFGPTFPGNYDKEIGVYNPFYPGMSFVFPVPSQFIRSLNKYLDDVKNKCGVGMRFKTNFEEENSLERRFLGTIIGESYVRKEKILWPFDRGNEGC